MVHTLVYTYCFQVVGNHNDLVMGDCPVHWQPVRLVLLCPLTNESFQAHRASPRDSICQPNSQFVDVISSSVLALGVLPLPSLLQFLHCCVSTPAHSVSSSLFHLWYYCHFDSVFCQLVTCLESPGWYGWSWVVSALHDCKTQGFLRRIFTELSWCSDSKLISRCVFYCLGFVQLVRWKKILMELWVT